MKFRKTVGGIYGYGDFDRIELTGSDDSDWLTLVMHVGYSEDKVAIIIRGDEAVRDFHYALGRYVTLLDERRKSPH